jgi:transposase InsO family protein
VSDYDRYVRSGEISMSELCLKHGIARKTGYKMIHRRDEGGWPALADRSRAPLTGPHWFEEAVVMRVLQTRLDFPHWGAETIVDWLNRVDPLTVWPSASAAHGWLIKAGLVEPARRARRYSHPGKPATPPLSHPNQQWSVDFKGHFRTRDRRYCYPLTVVDSFSRYLIGCQSLTAPSFERVWPVFERLFREYGLPESILSDNGTPFSSNSVKRLSKLSVRWIRLGITPRLTQPGRPQQNGRHERIHGHMSDLVCSNPSSNSRLQQKQFDWFFHHHNYVRPHKALGKRVPADLYQVSPRSYPRHLPPLEYPDHFEVRRVRSSGEIKWMGQWFFLSDALVGEFVAFEPVTDECWVLKFGPIELGYFSASEKQLFLDRPRPAGKAENA